VVGSVSQKKGTRRWVRAALLFAVAASVGVCTTVPVAAGPEQDKTRVERKLSQARGDYDDSTSALVKATAAVNRAKATLAAARDDLAAVKEDLVVARAKDAAASKQLASATAAETTAALGAEQASAEVSRQRLQIAQFANATYQNGPMSALSVIVGARSTDDLLSAMQVIATVSGSQVVALTRYTSARTQMNVRLADARHTQDVATALRSQAAVALLRVKRLEARQRAQTAKVARLVAGRVETQRAAERARADARRLIRTLEKERSEITARLRAIARKRAVAERRRAAERAAAQHRAPAPAPAPAPSGGGLFGRPVNGPITSPFGLRFHPILHYWRLHDGMDFGVACGTPLYAARGGRVVDAYYGGGYGNRVIIDHGWLDGASMSTSYNHMTRFIVHAGQQLSRGQLIGYSGTTGLSTGCHLHFMVYRNGTPVNPAKYL
jgi:murein DD-endopeptidase MepM/ murein hydrolase activator NlpD